eukprot:12370845-Alexandrium_andersonii.AAC.1
MTPSTTLLLTAAQHLQVGSCSKTGGGASESPEDAGSAVLSEHGGKCLKLVNTVPWDLPVVRTRVLPMKVH